MNSIRSFQDFLLSLTVDHARAYAKQADQFLWIADTFPIQTSRSDGSTSEDRVNVIETHLESLLLHVRSGNVYAAPTVTRIMPKREFQTMRKALVSQGFNVVKIDNGYSMALPNGQLLLKAMSGNNGYLVTLVENLFE